jgi:glutamate/tyrosine decarboxylase-like PLP-dependent enzyme
MSLNSLDPSPEEFQRMGAAALEAMLNYHSTIRDRRVYPRTSAQEIRGKLESELPNEPVEFERLLETFTEVVLPFSRHNAHPRMFGYVQSPGTTIAAIADFLASSLNANLTAWRSAPAAVEIERLTINWIKQIVGFDSDAAGLFVSGGSMANFAAIAAARTAKLAANSAVTSSSAQDERQGALRLYCSNESHYSIEKAATLLGLARDSVRKIAVDKNFRIHVDELVRQISRDIAAGHEPFCIVANAGTVMTGAVDPLAQLAEVARRYQLWLHVDGAYGGFAILAPSTKPLFNALHQADSISLDPHKWLYLPVDCGCVLYRNPQAARATFAHEAEYTRVFNQEADEAFAFWDYGPELSRRFRALKVWMLFKGVGLRALGEAIEKNIACAGYLEKLVWESEDFEMLAPVELSIFCFRYLPQELKGSGNEREINALNERLLTELQRDGSSYLSNALIGDRFALRGCVLNYRTTFEDMEILLRDLRRVAAHLTN